VGLGEFVQGAVAGDQLLHAVGHGGGGGDGVDPDLGGELDGHGAGDGGDAAFRGGVAVAAGNAHQGDVRRHVDNRAAAGTKNCGNAEAAAEEGAEQIQLDGAPEFVQRRLGHVVVAGGGAAGVVVQDVQRAVVADCLVDGGFDAVGVGDVGWDGEGGAAFPGDQVCGLLAGGLVAFGDDDAGALLGEQYGGGAADAGSGAGDEGDFALQAWHFCSSGRSVDHR
jgi:hypothetical protein